MPPLPVFSISVWWLNGISMHWGDGFEPEILAAMSTAFDLAWSKLKELGHATDDDGDRNILASHILAVVQIGRTDIAEIARAAAELFRREKGTA